MLPVTQAAKKVSEPGKAISKHAPTGRARRLSKERLDDNLEEALEETFPGSDRVALIEPAPEDPNLRLDESHRWLLRTFRGQQVRLSRVTNLVAGFCKARVRSLQIQLEPRWAAACGAWFGALLAVLLGLTDWRVAVMAAATAFMLARAGDIPDDS